MDKLKTEISDGIGWIILNQPGRYNAIDLDMIRSFQSILDKMENEERVKLIVIKGAGESAFCSGGDLSVFHQLHTEEQAYEMLSKMGKVLYKLYTFPKPTIAYLNGVAVGGGCEIASACDFRVAPEHVKMGFIQGSLGITTGWGGSTFLLERLQSECALELLMSANKISAKRGYEIGFIQKILDSKSPSDDFINWIKPFLSKGIDVLKTYKQRYLDTIDLKNIEERIGREISECSRLWAMEEHHQAVQAFLKRK